MSETVFRDGGKPFVNGTRRPTVVQDLLSTQCQPGHKWNVE